MSTSNFYTDLPASSLSVNELLIDERAFHQIPYDWSVIITDIRDSSIAVENGLSQLVNLVATGSIIAVLNIAGKAGIDIPFFFGGDGATLLVPTVLLSESMDALVQHQMNAEKEFSLHLRVGSVSISEVYGNGSELKLAKVKRNAIFSIPIVLGNGLLYAEEVIKSEDPADPPPRAQSAKLNLEGMECRWNRIPPPAKSNEVVCLLVQALNESKQAHTFKKVLDAVDSIYGELEKWHPISTTKLSLDIRPQKIKTELRMRQPGFSIGEWLKNWFFVLYGKMVYSRREEGRKYLHSLVQLSDIFVIDGKINMVISGTADQHKRLEGFLQQMEENEEIQYGIYASRESIISCYVRDRKAQHIHFVDGSDGGYTKAAASLKQKMRAKND